MRNFVSASQMPACDIGGRGWLRYRSMPKRIVDLAITLAAAPFVVPLVALFWVLVRLDGGPGFYVQPRVGRHGSRFNFVKLRTMVVDSEAALKKHCESDARAAAEWASMQKLANDPRITPIGRFLRGSSLDELPQLWNVFRGDMSIVGPRPFMVDQEDEYRQAGGSAYYDLRPGITGLWQVSARNEVSFRDRVGFDSEYLSKLSLATDLKIIVQTVPAVLKGTGK